MPVILLHYSPKWCLLLSRNDELSGVIHNDEMVMQKLNIAVKRVKPIDGHAPGLRGQQAATYFHTVLPPTMNVTKPMKQLKN